MASMPLNTDAAMSSGGIISGMPSAVAYVDYLLTWLPDIMEDAINETLEEHVNESRESLKRDADYHRLSQYYDVVEDEDVQHTLVFGLFDVPSRMQAKATALEFGDATTPPRAFVRRTLFKANDKIAKKVDDRVRHTMGEVVADA